MPRAEARPDERDISMPGVSNGLKPRRIAPRITPDGTLITSSGEMTLLHRSQFILVGPPFFNHKPWRSPNRGPVDEHRLITLRAKSS